MSDDILIILACIIWIGFFIGAVGTVFFPRLFYPEHYSHEKKNKQKHFEESITFTDIEIKITKKTKDSQTK